MTIVAGMVWPPPELAKVTEKTAEAQVWWAGSLDGLTDFYANNNAANGRRTLGQRGKDAYNAFHGRQASATAQPIKRIHVPIAGDITKLSASALMSEPLTMVATEADKALQDTIDAIFNTPTFHSDLFAAAESCSALGGNFQRIVWDQELADHPWIDFVDADRAIPEYRWGRLVAVTFWSELDGSDDRVVWRHLERHEPGKIVHQLFQGTSRDLGKLMALPDHPATEGITVTADDYIETGTDRLTAGYVPNVLPNPEWRHDPKLKYLGRSDLSSDVIPLFHALDEVKSSEMRDFRIGKARMFASDSLLTNLGAGQGQMLPEDQEVFTRVGNGIGSDGNLEAMFQFHQPLIRVAEHSQGAENIIREILRRVGYSPLSFGMADEVAQTATEATGKQKLTVTTTLGKARHWGASLGPLATTLLHVDAHLFSGTKPTEDVEIEWPPFARDSDLERAMTVQALSIAGAMSTRSKVAYVNQDKDADWIDEEVDEIRKDSGMSVPEPDFGGGDRPPIPPEPPVETDTNPEE
ncbi:hypothetical protein B2J88_08015 [Rhodococcus sp. SRB_17]|nr:hypothetical protein [Rhodococcus sp. SRB_17]